MDTGMLEQNPDTFDATCKSQMKVEICILLRSLFRGRARVRVSACV